jgi:hypothetical protein
MPAANPTVWPGPCAVRYVPAPRRADCNLSGVRITKVILTLFAAGTLLAGEAGEHPYKEGYKREIVGKKAILMTGGRAVAGQVLDTPKGWGRGLSGFGKRVASGFTTHIVMITIEYPIAALRHEDLLYHPSMETGFGPRMKHALLSTVITQKTTTGKNTVASGRIAGAFGSGLISRLWQPAASKTIGLGFASGGICLGADAGFNVVREFWPRHKKPVVDAISAASQK